jgi:hypothetical protein
VKADLGFNANFRAPEVEFRAPKVEFKAPEIKLEVKARCCKFCYSERMRLMSLEEIRITSRMKAQMNASVNFNPNLNVKV